MGVAITEVIDYLPARWRNGCLLQRRPAAGRPPRIGAAARHVPPLQPHRARPRLPHISRTSPPPPHPSPLLPQIYDPATNKWRLGPVLPQGRGGMGKGIVLGGTLFVMGGESDIRGGRPSVGLTDARVFNRVDAYNISTSKWHKVGRSRGPGAVLCGAVLCTAGAGSGRACCCAGRLLMSTRRLVHPCRAPP
jgi:hypothetical protein